MRRDAEPAVAGGEHRGQVAGVRRDRQMADPFGPVLVQQAMPSDRLRRQNQIVARDREAIQAAVFAQQCRPGGAGLPKADRSRLASPAGGGRRQRRFQCQACQTVGERAARVGRQAHRRQKPPLRIGADLVIAAVHIPPDRVDTSQPCQMVKLDIGDARFGRRQAGCSRLGRG